MEVVSMKQKNVGKHIKSVKFTMKFDNAEAMNSAYKKLQKLADDTAVKVTSSHVRIECYPKRLKIVVKASGRDVIDNIF
jgi:hypothetical protein